MPQVFIALSTFIVPMIMIFIYALIVKLFSFNRLWLVFFTILIFFSVYFFILYITYFLDEKFSLFERVFCTIILYMYCFIVGFPFIHISFLNSYHPNHEMNKNINKDCSHVSEYFLKSKTAIIIGYVYRTVLFSGGVSIFLVFLARWYFEAGLQHQVVWVLSCITGIIAYLFFSCMAFLRLLIKCPNCESYVFYIDQNLEAFFIIAKRVVKERILDCVYCKATYALDPKLDLDELRAKKKVMLAEKKNPDELYP